MILIEKIEDIGVNNLALIIRALLDRVPILVYGREEDNIVVQEVIEDLCFLIGFREQMIFGTDFISFAEYETLVEIEEQDYTISRTIFISFPSSTRNMLSQSSKLNSWIMGFDDMLTVPTIKHEISQRALFYLSIRVPDEENSKFQVQIEGRNFPVYDLSFEKKIYEQAIENTSIAVTKMKRVLSKRMKGKHLGSEEINSLLDFSIEENELKLNLMKRSLNGFYQAAKRALFIMNRVQMLADLGIKAVIAGKTLLKTISYELASSNRILDFINTEWDYNLQPVNQSREAVLGDQIESMWG